MEIEIEQTVTKRIKEKVKIECPSFFRNKSEYTGDGGGDFVGIYSPDKVSIVHIGNYHTRVVSGSLDVISAWVGNVDYPMSETAFNEILAQAILKIAGVEIHPELQTA
jgi:hypothetical protein